MFERQTHIVGDKQIEIAVAVIVQESATRAPARLIIPKPGRLVTSVKVPSPLLRYSRFCPK